MWLERIGVNFHINDRHSSKNRKRALRRLITRTYNEINNSLDMQIFNTLYKFELVQHTYTICNVSRHILYSTNMMEVSKFFVASYVYIVFKLRTN